MNYFNYFTEIEDAFIRRRGKHLYLSPVDWALIESWKEMGIPLYVALRGIERSFDSFEAKPRRRSVKSLLYCQEEVEAQFAEWKESQVGAGAKEKNGDHVPAESADDSHLPFSRASMLGHLENVRREFIQVGDDQKCAGELRDALARAASRLNELEEDLKRALRPDAQKLEESLASLEKMLDEALLKSLSPNELSAARAEAEAQLQPYRSRMERAVFEQTLDNLLLKRLRDAHSLPRLSLFYL